jgi:putative transposase
MSDRMTSDLTVDALKMAIVQRQPELALLHHSDQGSQYTDGTYQALLKDHGIQVSMNGVGSWYDNVLDPVAQGHRAPMESFFGTLKSEWVYHRVYRTRDEARSDIFYYIEAFYNRRRLHSSLGYLSPEEYELIHTTEGSFA